MKQLIIYYSFTHNNELLAKALQRHLECDLLKIETVKRRSAFSIFMDILFNRMPTLCSYQRIDRDVDHYVFIAPIWGGRIASPLKTFLQNEKHRIKNYSFITLCGGGRPQKDKIEKELKTLLQIRPLNVTELWVTDLLALEQKKKVTSYRATELDLDNYKDKIGQFVAHCKSLQYKERRKGGPQIKQEVATTYLNKEYSL